MNGYINLMASANEFFIFFFFLTASFEENLEWPLTQILAQFGHPSGQLFLLL